MRGLKIKGYEIWGHLSRGGMSDVWLARHSDLALPVVIKTLPTSATESLESRYARLLREARVTARLTSSRVVRVIDVGLFTPEGVNPTEAVPYLVEEYVDGIDLAEFDRRRRTALARPLPLWAVADQICQAAEGLHAAHQAGVVHCDVKPSNLFGQAHAHIKVGDFGVAIAASADPSGVAGTPLFMAPEQLLGERLDRRADVYSLGATAFALRYGHPPYASAGDALRGETGPRFPPARTPEEAYFQHVVARMMARKPDGRYSNLMIPRHQLRSLSLATVPRLSTARVGEHTIEMGGVRISFEIGDISRVETDAIVSSASSHLRMRAGVAEALRVAGGDVIEDEAMAGGERALGDCVVTGGGTLACKRVIHAVGGWNEVSCVARAMWRALLIAEERGDARIALPAIATGSERVSIEACADSMVGALRQHISLGGSRLREVRFVLYDAEKFARFTEVAGGLLFGAEDAQPFDLDLDAMPGPREASEGPTLFATPGGGRSGGAAPVIPRVPTERLRD